METIYHLAPADRWQHWPAEEPYLPAEYERDGFVHLTAGRTLMIQVANRFYRDVPGTFVLLKVDPQRLTSELRWEPGSHGEPQLFPHLYGPLDVAAVVEVQTVFRDATGQFLG